MRGRIRAFPGVGWQSKTWRCLSRSASPFICFQHRHSKTSHRCSTPASHTSLLLRLVVANFRRVRLEELLVVFLSIRYFMKMPLLHSIACHVDSVPISVRLLIWFGFWATQGKVSRHDNPAHCLTKAGLSTSHLEGAVWVQDYTFNPLIDFLIQCFSSSHFPSWKAFTILFKSAVQWFNGSHCSSAL